MSAFAIPFAIDFSCVAALVTALNCMPRLGRLGKAVMTFCTKAPGLDLVLALLIWIPWLFSSLVWGGLGLLATLIAQFVILQGWIIVHESIHRNVESFWCPIRFYDGKNAKIARLTFLILPKDGSRQTVRWQRS